MGLAISMSAATKTRWFTSTIDCVAAFLCFCRCGCARSSRGVAFVVWPLDARKVEVPAGQAREIRFDALSGAVLVSVPPMVVFAQESGTALEPQLCRRSKRQSARRIFAHASRWKKPKSVTDFARVFAGCGAAHVGGLRSCDPRVTERSWQRDFPVAVGCASR